MDNEEINLKVAFAAFFVELTQNGKAPMAAAFEAALRLYPAEKDRGTACQVSFSWPNDSTVILEIARLEEEGITKKLPKKQDAIELAWKLASSDNVAPKDRVAMLRLMADMSGFIAKIAESDIESKRMPTAPVYKMVTE